VEYSLKIKKMPDLGKSNEEYFEELYDLIDENVRPTSLIPIIDLKYFAKYNKKAGFKLSVDGFHNIKKDAILVTIFSLNPPGYFYKEGEIN